MLRDRHAVKSRYVWRIPALKEYIENNQRPSVDGERTKSFDDVWQDIEVAVAQTLVVRCLCVRCVGGWVSK